MCLVRKGDDVPGPGFAVLLGTADAELRFSTEAPMRDVWQNLS